MVKTDHSQEMLALLKELFEERIPFNKVLGIRFRSLDLEQVCLEIRMKEELIGNFAKGVLHGGVISAILDVTGGVVAMVDLIQRMKEHSIEELSKKLINVGTIDLRVDYLRPGKGAYFSATGVTMRTGHKVAVIRSELHNDQGLLIAAGTGTYIVG